MGMKHDKFADIIISIAVMQQPMLILLQMILINVFHMSPEATTSYRVVLTAVPMLLAIFLAARRRLGVFIIGYLVALVVMLLHSLLFPANAPYISEQGLRFFLPVVLPSFLCLLCLDDYVVVEKVLYFISWVSTLLCLLYTYSFLRGVFLITNYNMAFSYACLLPMVSLYLHRNSYDIIAVLLLFIVVLAIGSRGAAVCFCLFVIVDSFQRRTKYRWLIICLFFAVLLFLPVLGSVFTRLGVTSRTLNMFMEGSITADSGRNAIQQFFWKKLLNSPLTGLGIWGDRVVDDIAYCHNLLLEICVDYGLLFGSILIIYLLIKFLNIYKSSNYIDRNHIIGYFAGLVLPLFVSGSYLINNEFAIFLGLCCLINKKNMYAKFIAR